MNVNISTKISVIFFLVLCYSCKASTESDSIPVQPSTESLLAFIAEGNVIKVWNAATDSTTIIADLEDSLRITEIAFTDANIITYSVYQSSIELAVLKETGDTLKCPCSDADEWIVSGLVVSDRYDQIEYYMDTVQAISISNGTSWIDKIIKYQHTDREKVLIQTRTFDREGELLTDKDSTYTCYNVSFNDLRCQCQNEVPSRHEMYSQSEEENGIYFFTKNGHLYEFEQEVDKMYFEYSEFFEYKFGRGYYHPTLNYDASKVVVGYSETGFYTGLSNTPSSLLLIDVQSKNVDTISTDNLQFPVFSGDGNYISITRDPLAFRDDDHEIRIYDVKKDKYINLGIGYKPIWLGKKEHIRSY
jgi:hypothetical protein